MDKIKVSTTKNLIVFMVDPADNITGQEGLTLTITASKDGVGFGVITPVQDELEKGWYKLELTTDHTDTVGTLAVHIEGNNDPRSISDLKVEIVGAIELDIFTELLHVPKCVGTIYYVNDATGDDGNVGNTPDEAYATIQAALTAVAEGDKIVIQAGGYTEDDLSLNTDYVEILCDHGVSITNNFNRPAFILDAHYTQISNAVFLQTDNTGLSIPSTVNGAKVTGCLALACATGFSIEGDVTIVTGCASAAHTSTGFYINNTSFVDGCISRGTGAGCIGVHLDGSGDNCVITNTKTANNAVAGWQVDAGADSNTFVRCSTSTTDGVKVDNGANNSWVLFATGSDISAGESIEYDLNAIYTRIGAPVALDSGSATVSSMLTKMADDNDGADFDATTDSLQAIRDNQASVAPSANISTGSSIGANGGTVTSGTHTDTQTSNDTYWSILQSGVSPYIDVMIDFVGSTGDIPVEVIVEGRFFNAHPNNEWIDIYIYNYSTTSWDKISGSGAATRMQNEIADRTYHLNANSNHINSGVDEAMRLKFISGGGGLEATETLDLDYVSIQTQRSSDLTKESIAQEVWNSPLELFTDPGTAGVINLLTAGIIAGEIIGWTDSTHFQIDVIPPIANTWNNHIIVLWNKTTNQGTCVPIASIDMEGNVVIEIPTYLTHEVGDPIRIVNETAPGDFRQHAKDEIKDECADAISDATGATVDAVWDEATSTHTTAGSTGQALIDAKYESEDRSNLGSDYTAEDLTS